MTADEHDRLVAAISHLPLVLSAALVEAVAGPIGDPRPDWPAAEALAAGGWASMTRLARGDVEMGAGIAATNAAEIAARLRDVRAVDRWLARGPRRRGRRGHGRDPPAAGVRARHGRGRGLNVGVAGERVLVVPREAIVPAPGWTGVRREGVVEALEAVAREGVFVDRAIAEEDRTHKQVIPYVVLRDGERWFLMRRTRAGGDARLHDLWSIGVGGHLNPGDGDVAGGLRREWAEELVADFVPEFAPIGLLNDDTTPVGSVHVGIVFTADAAGRPVEIRETDKLTGAFATTEEVAAVVDAWRPGAGWCSRPSPPEPSAEPPAAGVAATVRRARCHTRVAAMSHRSRTVVRRLGRSLALIGLLATVAAGIVRAADGDVVVLTATGTVDNVMANYLADGIAQAASSGAPAVVVQLNTPGGSLDATQHITSAFLEADVPVIVWITPSGGRAASAGTFITMAANLAYMSPGTNIGAASPVGSNGEDIPGTLGEKVKNDAIANITSIAETRGRPVDWAVSTVVGGQVVHGHRGRRRGRRRRHRRPRSTTCSPRPTARRSPSAASPRRST